MRAPALAAISTLALLFACGEDTEESTGTCVDNIQNQGEQGVDCGGPCPACSTPTCTDGVQNQGETGVDCGGPCAPCVSELLMSTLWLTGYIPNTTNPCTDNQQCLIEVIGFGPGGGLYFLGVLFDESENPVDSVALVGTWQVRGSTIDLSLCGDAPANLPISVDANGVRIGNLQYVTYTDITVREHIDLVAANNGCQ